MSNQKYELKHGRALIIVGFQCRSTTTLARNIAAQHGTFAEINVHELEAPFGLGKALASESDTLIVDGFPSTQESIAKIKAAITSSGVICDLRGQEPKVVKTPNFIFRTGDKNPLHIDAHSRRFTIIRIEADNG